VSKHFFYSILTMATTMSLKLVLSYLFTETKNISFSLVCRHWHDILVDHNFVMFIQSSNLIQTFDALEKLLLLHVYRRDSECCKVVVDRIDSGPIIEERILYSMYLFFPSIRKTLIKGDTDLFDFIMSLDIDKKWRIRECIEGIKSLKRIKDAKKTIEILKRIEIKISEEQNEENKRSLKEIIQTEVGNMMNTKSRSSSLYLLGKLAVKELNVFSGEKNEFYLKKYARVCDQEMVDAIKLRIPERKITMGSILNQAINRLPMEKRVKFFLKNETIFIKDTIQLAYIDSLEPKFIKMIYDALGNRICDPEKDYSNYQLFGLSYDHNCYNVNMVIMEMEKSTEIKEKMELCLLRREIRTEGIVKSEYPNSFLDDLVERNTRQLPNLLRGLCLYSHDQIVGFFKKLLYRPDTTTAQKIYEKCKDHPNFQKIYPGLYGIGFFGKEIGENKKRKIN